MQTRRISILALTLLTVAAFAQAAKGPYDPSANAWKDIQRAGRQAAAEHKNVLVVVGGNWCPWCRALDRLMTTDAAVHKALVGGFELVHVNYSKENKNPKVMERLGDPEKDGFPVLVVLSPDLSVLHVQPSDVFELHTSKKPGHDPAKVVTFLKRWAPARG